jgi:formylglycine-generating enzyme required for sulfatase activity
MVAMVLMWECGNPAGGKNTTPIFPTMVSIPADTSFQMGSASVGATPVHSVTLGAFTMSQTLVTQAQYQSIVGTNPASFDSGRTWPVEQVSWYDAALYCNALSKLAGLDTVYN